MEKKTSKISVAKNPSINPLTINGRSFTIKKEYSRLQTMTRMYKNNC